MVKITDRPLSSYQIPRQEGGKQISSAPQKSTQGMRERFHNSAFADLKKLNYEIALIQKTQISLKKIQRELEKIQHDNPQPSQPHIAQKVHDLQTKLAQIIEHAQKNKLLDSNLRTNLTPANLENFLQKLSIVQNDLAGRLDQAIQENQSFFASNQEFDLQEEMLKDPRLKVAHDATLFNRSGEALIL